LVIGIYSIHDARSEKLT